MTDFCVSLKFNETRTIPMINIMCIRIDCSMLNGITWVGLENYINKYDETKCISFKLIFIALLSTSSNIHLARLEMNSTNKNEE